MHGAARELRRGSLFGFGLGLRRSPRKHVGEVVELHLGQVDLRWALRLSPEHVHLACGASRRARCGPQPGQQKAAREERTKGYGLNAAHRRRLLLPQIGQWNVNSRVEVGG